MRNLRLTGAFCRSAQRLAVGGSDAGRAVATTIRQLCEEALPGPADVATMVPPVRTTWSRRVGARNLWLYYTFTDEELMLCALSPNPPVSV